VLVVAGPGAGKTFCLIGRIGYLITRHGIAPDRILALTFTNKAADEIAERLGRELGPNGRMVARGTLHSRCLHILRAWPEQAGVRAGFGVADEEYQAAVLRKLRVREEQTGNMLSLFGRARLHAFRLEPHIERLFQAYRGALRRRNLLDFDDLITHTQALFESHPDVRRAVAAEFDAVLVDEFQDLTPVQYAIVRALAEPHRNLFAVGDDEQSIYGFAGADREVLRRFATDYATSPIVLVVNHRNSRAIFDAARRVLRSNETLFVKELTASRETSFAVEARGFPSEKPELEWLAGDLKRDRAAHGLDWGDVAVLFRTHRLGHRLESELLKARIPVRTAEGRAVVDDPVAAPVLAALRLIQDPTDPVPIEILVRWFLDAETREVLRSRFAGKPTRASLRQMGRDPTIPEGERRRVRKLLYHIENLPAMARTTATLGDLVDAVLLERPTGRRTQIEERADELTDPAELPGVRALAETVAAAREEGHRIFVKPCLGVEFAITGLLGAAGLGHLMAETGATPGPEALVLDPVAGPGLSLRLFKALQLLAASRVGLGLSECVTFDLETTGVDTGTARILEIGAARVRGGQVVETFQQLVDPEAPIPEDASLIHGYRDADVQGKPTFTQAWPRFREFIGNDILVAHNGRRFDLPVLARQVKDLGLDSSGLAVFDTYPLARALVTGGASLGHLARTFSVELPQAHHALDDSVALANILRGLDAMRQVQSRRTAFPSGLEWLAVALVLERGERTAEESVLLEIGKLNALGRYGDSLEKYDSMRRESGRDDAPAVEELIQRLGGRELMQRLRQRRTAAERFPTSIARLKRLFEGLEGKPVQEGIVEVLDLAALSRRDGSATQAGAVSLLTLHATKGLEFSRVYIVGVEDNQFQLHRQPEEHPEARRLLYVGMTRARDRLVLTRTGEREGRPTGGTSLIEETGVTLTIDN
jgi:superfamily I DNA/RNA helicase